MYTTLRVKNEEPREVFLIVHGVRSAENVGSMFRTSDGAGVSHVYLHANTPQPKDKFGRVNSKIAKVALGAESSVSWSNYTSISSLLKKLKNSGFAIVALEQDKKSITWRNIPKSNKIAIVVGHEVDGLDKKIIAKCDYVAEIPMLGKKESLNVSVATAIMLYSLI